MVHKKDGRYNTKAHRVVYDLFMLLVGSAFIFLGVLYIFTNPLGTLMEDFFLGMLCIGGGSFMLYVSTGVWILD